MNTDKINQLRELLESEESWTTEYYSNNTDCGHAEFVATLGYGDADIRKIVSNALDCLNAAYKDIDEDGIADKLKSDPSVLKLFITPESVDNYADMENSICSVGVGEVEVQLSDDVIELMGSMTEEEVEEVCRGFCISGDHMYVNMGGTIWHAVLDVDGLYEQLLDNV